MEKLDHRLVISEEERELIAKIESFINQYEIGGNLGLVKLDPAICESLNIDRATMAEMSSEDVYHSAYLIQSHISRVITDRNRHKIIFQQIESAYKDAINHYLPSMSFPEFTKYEAKEQIICEKYETAFKLRELMRKVHSVIILYDDVIEPFRKMADTLNNLARTK